MSILVIEGEPGAGKTTFATKLALDYMANGRRAWGRAPRVITNYEISHPDVEFGSWQEMQEANKAVCIMDEAQRWFNAREWTKNGPALPYFEAHRKDGLTLFLVCQSINQLDKQVRDLAAYVWHVTRCFGPDEYENPTWLEKHIGWWAVAKKYKARDYGLVTKQLCVRKQRFRLDVLHGKFDTLAKQAGRDGGIVRGGVGLAGHGSAGEGKAAPPGWVRDLYDVCAHRSDWHGRIDWKPLGSDLLEVSALPVRRVNASSGVPSTERHLLRDGSQV